MDDSKYMNLIKQNIKYIIFVIILLTISIMGITYAIKVNGLKKNVDIALSNINANITYDNLSNTSSIVSDGKMMPISDELITGSNVTDERVLKASFYISGSSSNPANTIYDVTLRNVNADCTLKSKDLKWRLYKKYSSFGR